MLKPEWTPSGPRDLPHLEGLHDVALLDVLVVAQDQTALEALADLGGVVLLPLQRGQVEILGHDGAVADQAHLGVAADHSAGDHAAGDVADLRGAEDRADLRLAESLLLELRLEHALERGLDLLDGLVDDRVVAHLDAFLVRQLGRLALRPDVEADDDRVGRRCQHDVGLGGRPNSTNNNAQRHLVADIDLGQRVLQGLHRTGHVALEDQCQLLALALLHGRHEVLERTTHAALCLHGGALARLALLGDLAGHPVVLDHQEVLTRTRHGRQTQHHRGLRGEGLLHRLGVLVEQCPDAAVRRTGDDRVTNAERAALHQHGRHRTAATVQVRLDDQTLGGLPRVRAQVERRIGSQHDRLEQLVEVQLGLGRDIDEHGVAAVLLGHQAVLGELAANLRGVRLRLVDLVHRHHDRHLGRLGVVQRLHRLRHHPVVSRDHEDRDVRGLRAAGTHGGERLVTRGVDERDRPLGVLDHGVHLVGTDVLGDAAGLLVHDVGRAEGVEELGLAVVHVTHHGDHGRTYDEIRVVALVLAELEVERLEQLAVLVLGRDDLHDVVQLVADQLEGLVTDGLRGGHHLAEREEHLHQRGGVDVDLLGEVGQRGATRETDRLAVALPDAHATDRRRLHLLELLATRPLRLATTTGRAARTAEGPLGLPTPAGTSTATRTATEGGPAATRRSTGAGTDAAATSGRTDAAASRGAAPTGSTPTSRGATATGATGGAARPTGAAVPTEGTGVASDHRGVRARHAGMATGRR